MQIITAQAINCEGVSPGENSENSLKTNKIIPDKNVHQGENIMNKSQIKSVGLNFPGKPNEIRQPMENTHDDEDDCVYIGATHFIDLISDEEEDDDKMKAPKILTKEQSQKEDIQKTTPPLNLANTTTVVEDLFISDDEQEAENDENFKKPEQVSQTINDAIKENHTESNESKVDEKMNAISNEIANENYEKSNEGNAETDQKKVDKAKETANGFISKDINEELKDTKNKENIQNSKENIKEENCNYFENNIPAEIFPELTFEIKVENNLDVKAMEMELDNVLKDIDANQAKITNDENIEILKNEKIKVDKKEVENIQGNENIAAPKVVWSAIKAFNKKINFQQTISNLEENEVEKEEKCTSNEPKVLWTPAKKNALGNVAQSNKKSISDVVENEVLTEDLSKNSAQTNLNKCQAFIEEVANSSKEQQIGIEAQVNKTIIQTENENGTDEDYDDDDDDSSDISDSSSGSESSDESTNDDNENKVESDVESGDLKGDTGDNGQALDEPSPKKMKKI